MFSTVRFSLFSYCLLSKNVKVKTYRTVILLVVLYVCKTWSLTLGEQHRLRVFENSVLRRIFGRGWDEVKGQWRKLHSGELHNLYSSPDIIRQIKSRRMRWAGHVARTGKDRKGTSFWRESPKERDHSEDRGVGFGWGWRGVEWIDVAQNWDRWYSLVSVETKLPFLVPRSSYFLCCLLPLFLSLRYL
jgi:hypothetical protein